MLVFKYVIGVVMKKIIFTIFLSLLVLSSCSKKEDKELKISTNPWIGYAPLFYAKEMGYLNKLNISLIHNISLSESTKLYSMGKVDMIAATQHEYFSLLKIGEDIVPISLLDRSDGGDIVLSNRSLNELKSADKIFAYLEIDSINIDIIKDFIKHHKLDMNKIEFINADQVQIADLQINKNKNMLLVTYVPYNYTLEKSGFIQLASTKNLNSIVVVDGILINKKVLQDNKEKLLKFKQIIDKSITEITKNKQASYKLVKKYLDNMPYNEYIESFELIKWENIPSKEILDKLKDINYESKYLLK